MSRYSSKQQQRVESTLPAGDSRLAASSARSTRAVAPSLPPAPDLSPAPPRTRPSHHLEKSSLVRKKAVAIVAMRANGFTTDEIAAELRIKPASVASYLWKATKNGFLVNRKGESLLSDPKDHIEYELAHKVIRNLSASLDDEPVTIRSTGEIKEVSRQMHDTTMRLAEGSLFKRFDQPKESSVLPGMHVLAIKIEMPNTGGVVVREGSIGGTPNYVDGSVDESTS